MSSLTNAAVSSRAASSWVWRPIGLALVVLSVILWKYTWDDRTGTDVSAVLGGYRYRWFIINCAVTYAAVWIALHGLLRFSKRTILRILGVHTSLLFGLLLLDLPAIFGLLDYPDLFRKLQLAGFGPDRSSQPNQKLEGKEYPDIALWMGLDAPAVPYVYQTDRFGLRNPRDKPDARIFCLGDSIVVAAMLPIEQLISERLESKLGVGVMNVAHVGIGPQEGLALLDWTGIDLRGRLVLHFFFEGNDLSDHQWWRRANSKITPRPWKNLPKPNNTRPEWLGAFHAGEPWPLSGLFGGIMWRLQRPKRGMMDQRFALCPDAATKKPIQVYFKYDAESVRKNFDELPYVLSTLKEAKADVESRGGVYAVVFVPMKMAVLKDACEFPGRDPAAVRELGESGLEEILKTECAKASIPFIDPTPVLAAAVKAGDLPFLTHDTHLNGRGHELIADVIEPFVRQQLSALGTAPAQPAPPR